MPTPRQIPCMASLTEHVWHSLYVAKPTRSTQQYMVPLVMTNAMFACTYYIESIILDALCKADARFACSCDCTLYSLVSKYEYTVISSYCMHLYNVKDEKHNGKFEKNPSHPFHGFNATLVMLPVLSNKSCIH